MSSDAEQEIVRLLTELRDAQREELAYRRRVLDESIALQRRAVRWQRGSLLVILVGFVLLLIVGGACLLTAGWLPRETPVKAQPLDRRPS
jgi:hypothetical protein